jgi:outer membrane protein OmpU
MNKFKKIGLSALAGSLVAFSANAAEMSASGGASLTISDQGLAQENNKWTMGNSVTFSASGETDGGINVSASYELDDDVMDDYSMSFGTDAMGTITFSGSGGSSAMSAVDDMTPNAYEESWHGMKVDATATSAGASVINGLAGANMFSYTTPSFGGATLTASYLPSSATVSVKSSTAFAIAWSPEMAEGLTIGYAAQDDESGSATTASDDTSESTAYIKYVYGPVTVGYQQSDLDSDTNTEDAESDAFGITYAVSDNLTIGYGTHTWETTGNTSDKDQESTAITASYTSGGMTIAGIMNEVDNLGGTDTTDREGYELNLSFAF